MEIDSNNNMKEEEEEEEAVFLNEMNRLIRLSILSRFDQVQWTEFLKRGNSGLVSFIKNI